MAALHAKADLQVILVKGSAKYPKRTCGRLPSDKLDFGYCMTTETGKIVGSFRIHLNYHFSNFCPCCGSNPVGYQSNSSVQVHGTTISSSLYLGAQFIRFHISNLVGLLGISRYSVDVPAIRIHARRTDASLLRVFFVGAAAT